MNIRLHSQRGCFCRFKSALPEYEPASAAQWAMTLPPGEDRDETLKSVYQNWPETDPAAKEAFKKQHGIQ
jgi:hypothetical protein